MSLATPIALWGLLLLPLLALFYMWRAQHHRQVVASTWLWTEALARFTHRPSRRLPLREPLLILQLLAALALVLLLAGPRLDRAVHLNRIVVLDGSLEMQATDVAPTRFAAAVSRIHAMLDSLGEGDSLSLVLAGPQARLVGQTESGTNLNAAIDRLTPSVGAADLLGAADLARGLATDGSRGTPRLTFLAGAQTPVLPIAGLPVETVRMGGPLDDRGIESLAARCQGNACQVFARVRNTGATPAATALTIRADGSVLGTQTLRVPAHGTLDLTFALPRGARAVQASLDGHDALRADDTAWTLAPIPPRRNILLVSDNPSTMLRVLHSVPGVDVRTVPTSASLDTLSVGQDLVVLDSMGLISLPPNPLLLLNPAQDNGLIRVGASNVPLTAESVNEHDPLATGLNLQGISTIGSAVGVPPWAEVVAGGSRGPLLLEGSEEGRRVVVMPFDLSHNAGAIARNLAFPLLIARTIDWLVPMPPPSVAAGESVWLPSTVFSVTDPSGAAENGPAISPQLPGIYRVGDGFGGLATGAPLFTVSSMSSSQAVISTSAEEGGWSLPHVTGTVPLSLWPLLVLAALLALGGEWWFYARNT